MPAKYHEQLQEIFQIQGKIVDIHPFLERVFPVALVEDDQFLIFDTSGGQYVFVKQAPTPMPMPPGVQAAFPLECYDDRIACVVTEQIFDSLEGYVTIFHEFMHCQQFESGEFKLKQTLEIARKAMAENDFMWELNYPFPYHAPRFIELYTLFLQADDVSQYRRQLKQALGAGDFEYMVWQEWKEGFARLIENRIRRRLGLEENHRGKDQPFERPVFYAGGARLIEFLETQDPQLSVDIEKLFYRILE